MPLTIGQLAAQAGMNAQTVRYYERRELVPRPSRSGGGYRLYEPDTVSRLRFIKRAQDLGFSLEEIRELLALRVVRPAACERVEARTRAKIALVERKIAELSRMRATLEDLANACRRRERTAECPILGALEEVS